MELELYIVSVDEDEDVGCEWKRQSSREFQTFHPSLFAVVPIQERASSRARRGERRAVGARQAHVRKGNLVPLHTHPPTASPAAPPCAEAAVGTSSYANSIPTCGARRHGVCLLSPTCLTADPIPPPPPPLLPHSPSPTAAALPFACCCPQCELELALFRCCLRSRDLLCCESG